MKLNVFFALSFLCLAATSVFAKSGFLLEDKNSRVKVLGGRLLLDGYVEATGPLQIDKYADFVNVSTPTPTPATGHTKLFATSSKQLVALFSDGTTATFNSSSATITGVTAGVGLTGGGVLGTVTLNVDPSTVTMQGNTFNTASKLVKLNSSGQSLLPSGVNGTPVYSFAADPTAGIYYVAEGTIAVAGSAPETGFPSVVISSNGRVAIGGSVHMESRNMNEVLHMERQTHANAANSAVDVILYNTGDSSARFIANAGSTNSVSSILNYMVATGTSDAGNYWPGGPAVPATTSMYHQNNRSNVDYGDSGLSYYHTLASTGFWDWSFAPNRSVFQVTESSVNVKQNLVLSSAVYVGGTAGSSGQVLTSAGSSAVPTWAAAATSKFVQWVSSNIATNAATTSSTYQSTSLTVTITPTSASNKIFILASGLLFDATLGNTAHAAIFNGSTNLMQANGMCEMFSGAANDYAGCTLSWLDSPASTSAQTYTVKIKSGNNINTVGWGDTSSQFIIAVELAP